ncbi:HNH endonuclease [Clostridium saccharobutylicum]|uniref:HNH endonuclease n=1 Tax=Clostridium saccharobutylicum TaxID=169679 RepID=UPI000983BBF3|nr:HNH endonuclease [Clostridium saccharobutylicum]AQS09673.1 HNH endonuclease [Clostridium saccharobutylicum]MBC2436932.1 HNH endonuclease [Clostridium saccharobutylicum]NSB89283.1 5-methylcytosine-specific restriction endonuclease McrA [Clostridium saccharobutylicum]NYC27937.1 5-methylcytosine-specific restriction endonuclease McrA [Clostridium saccharobutylicum]OOM17132.1 HNH endonuclease [Clostridium saccharobutylicum]
MALKKCCPKCGRVIDYGLKYCNECSKNVSKEKAERNREYDKNVRKNVNVYGSKQWHLVRQECLARDNGLCMYCLKKYNKISYASLVHHIEEVNDDIELAYCIDNLISLCRKCHDDVHTMYNKDDKSKGDMQIELHEMIQCK